jgi:methionyl-tRNA formyltransferase
MKKKNKILLLFDKKNIVNLNFFDFENFRKKIKTGFYVKLSQNISEIKYFDYILLVGFTKKIKIQKKIKYYTVHESNLPKGRGNSPIKWQLLKKVNLIVCSLIRLND